MSSHLAWYTARATGVFAYVLVTAAVVWGLLLSGKPFGRAPTARWVLDLHRFLGGLSVVFLGVHIGALVADSYTHFGAAEILTPLASSWKPVPVALGVVAMYGLVAVEITSLAMRRLPRRLWRVVHLGSFGVFWLSSFHFLTAGTDARNPLLRGFAILASSTVLYLTSYRVLTARAPRLRDADRAGGPTPLAPYTDVSQPA